MRDPSSPKHRKRENKHNRQTGAIKRPRNQVRVILENLGMVIPQIILDEETRDDPAEENACLRLVVRDVPCVLDELRHVDFGDVEAADLGDKLVFFPYISWVAGVVGWGDMGG